MTLKGRFIEALCAIGLRWMIIQLFIMAPHRLTYLNQIRIDQEGMWEQVFVYCPLPTINRYTQLFLDELEQ